jgi:hypothetical protein
VMPTPFSPFLEEKEHERESGTKDLVQKRRYLKRTITMLKDELRTTDNELTRKRPDASGLAKQK